MPEAPSCVELDGQHVELLPTCAVLSLFSAAGGGGGGNGGATAPGGVGKGGLGLNLININLFGEQTNYAGNGWCGQGGSIGGAGGPAVS